MESYIENESWKSEEPISWFRHPDTFQYVAVLSQVFHRQVLDKSHELMVFTFLIITIKLNL